MLIDSSGSVKSFTTAYVPAASVLRMRMGAIQAVPEHSRE
jgi:hypothetical protein